MILAKYLDASGNDQTVIKTLKILQHYYLFRKIETTLFRDFNTCKVYMYDSPIISFFGTSLGWERWWRDHLENAGSIFYPDEIAVGLRKGSITLEMEKTIIIAHEWCHLLQMDGDSGIVRQRVERWTDYETEKTILETREIEAESWAIKFFLEFGEEILNISLNDYRTKIVPIEQLALFS